MSPTTESAVVSLRLSPAEQEAIRKQPIKCPTCRQPVTALPAIVRLSLRRMLKIQDDSEEED
jgi:hypothetical protein